MTVRFRKSVIPMFTLNSRPPSLTSSATYQTATASTKPRAMLRRLARILHESNSIVRSVVPQNLDCLKFEALNNAMTRTVASSLNHRPQPR